jgi:hypothetical protein
VSDPIVWNLDQFRLAGFRLIDATRRHNSNKRRVSYFKIASAAFLVIGGVSCICCTAVVEFETHSALEAEQEATVLSVDPDGVVETGLTFGSNNATLGPCQAPIYDCSRTDTAIIPIDALPKWGTLVGANTIFYDRNFNPSHPPKYVRVTDAQTGTILGVPNSSFAVGAGSGDDAHFNADDTLFTVSGKFAYSYVFGLKPDTMQTGLVWPTTAIANPVWSQVNPNYLYTVGNGGGLWRYDFSDEKHCRLGGKSCSPSPSKMYDFIANCAKPPGARLWENAGVGGGDVWFAAPSGTQDIDNRVYAYNANTQTCYFYNTRFGTIHAYNSTNQTVIKGDLTCDGRTSSVVGTNFESGPSWRGLNIVLTIGGAPKVFQVLQVSDRSHMQLGYKCPAGKYQYSIKPGAYVGPITLGENYSVHNIRMDPGGRWLVIEEGSYCYDQSGATATGHNCNVIHAWQLGTTTVNACHWMAGQPDISAACSGHYTETAFGWINDAGFSNSPNPSMQFRDWSKLTLAPGTYSDDIRQLNTGTSSSRCPSVCGGHPTAKNDPLGSHGYPIFSSLYTGELSAGTITVPYSNEIIGWHQSGGPVMRFGHTFNSSLEPHSQFGAWIAVGAASSTGRFYMFTSDGEGTLGNENGSAACSIAAGNCRSDVFILSLTPSD